MPLAEICVLWLLTRKTKNFISLWIKLATSQDYFRLKEYTWIPFSLTVAIVDRLEIPDLLFAIFYFAACAKSREQCRRLRI